MAKQLLKLAVRFMFFGFLFSANVPAFGASFKLAGKSCADYLSGGHLEIEITTPNPDDLANLIVVRRVAQDAKITELGRFSVYPSKESPETPPEYDYTLYQSGRDTDSLLILKVFTKSFQCPSGPCNAVFGWSAIGDGAPIHLNVRVEFS